MTDARVLAQACGTEGMAETDPSQADTAPTSPAEGSIGLIGQAMAPLGSAEMWFAGQGSVNAASDVPITGASVENRKPGLPIGPAPVAALVTASPPPATSHAAAPIPARPLPARPIVAQPIPAHPVPAQPVASNNAQSAPSDDAEEESDTVDAAARAAPPWLLSSVVHMLVLIILGLSVSARETNGPAVIVLDVYGDSLGDQPLDASVEISAPTLEPELEAPALALADLPEVSEPLAMRAQPTFMPQGDGAVRDLPAPAIGYALAGREAGRKQILLGQYGGDSSTEEAVQRALAWLKRNQRADGSWSLVGPYTDGSYAENTVAATAMALLAFQGAGHTHHQGEYKPVVEKGLSYLLKRQDGEGLFADKVVPNHQLLYAHGQATIVVCEAYGMTKDPTLLAPAERAVLFCVRSQSSAGGWRYAPKVDADTSVSGWILMGLQSAKMAGIEVPRSTFDNLSKYLDTVALEGGSKYCYQLIERDVRHSMTAEALLCRQYLGWDRNDERLLKGVAFLNENPIGVSKHDVYYWYYATQVCHHMEGEAWKQWNAVMKRALPASQEKSGPEAGSWNPRADEWGAQAGRLYQTCLSTYMLEVYYRHLPLYTKLFETRR